MCSMRAGLARRAFDTWDLASARAGCTSGSARISTVALSPMGDTSAPRRLLHDGGRTAAHLEEVARTGIATEHDEALLGESGVAAPVFDATGLAVGAIGVVLPSSEWPPTASIHDDLKQYHLPYVGAWAYSQTEWQDPFMFPTHMSMIHEAMSGAHWALACDRWST